MKTTRVLAVAAGVALSAITAFLFSGCSIGKSPARVAGAFALDPASDRRCEIVIADDAIEAEETAAALLMAHLPKMLGNVAFKTVRESAADPAAKRICVGWTKALGAAGLDCSGWGVEEELVAARNGTLFVAGGRTRGARYAAADFLEKLGVVVTGEDTSYDPVLERIEWTDDLRRTPAFMLRSIATHGNPERVFEFNKYNGYQGKKGCKMGLPEMGGYERYGRYGECHTFVAYSKEFPTDDPNVFAFSGGKRRVPEKAGQKAPLCPTSPRTLELMLAALEKDVARQYELEKQRRIPRARYYEVSMDDELTPCECPTCRKVAEEEGCYAGVMLRLVNPMAKRLAQLDPEAKLSMLVYQLTLAYPKVTKPEPNVLPRVCAHDVEWVVNVQAEAFAPLEHPYNAAFMETFDKWRTNTASFGVWEYFEYYTKGSFPYVFPKTYAEHLRWYGEHGAENILLEIEHVLDSFYPFKLWLGLKLMDDPRADLDALTDTFFRVHYGAAAKPMRAYLDHLAGACEKEMAAKPMGPRPFSDYAYLNESFYRESYRLLAEAEAAVADDERSLAHVRGEYIALDRSVLRPAKRAVFKALGFTRKDLVARMRRNEHAYVNALFGAGSANAKAQLKVTDAFLDGEAIDAPLPPEVKGANVFDFKYNAFTYSRIRLVDDPDALGGKAQEIGGDQTGRPDFHRLPFTMGIYNGDFPPDKRALANLRIDNPPQDEKYHLYHVGRVPIVKGTRIWAHWTWSFFYDPRDAHSATPDYDSDVWVSVKLQGPAYVKGSTKPNGAFLDRIIVARE